MTSPGAPLRFGILGAANIAPLALIRPAREDPNVEVVAVAARDAEKARRFAARHDVARVHKSYEALLADPQLDAIYNPLPNSHHGLWTLRALAAGKHVLCEKPFSANAAEAQRVADAARASGLVVMEAFHWRYHPLAARLLEIVASGELGELRHVEAQLCAPLIKPGDIRYRGDLAGGAAMDMGCYTVSIVRALAGAEPSVVSARAKLSSPGVDRAMEAELAFPGGASGRVVCSMFSWRLFGISARVRGTRGELRVFNPIAPQFFHRVRVKSERGNRSERVSDGTSYGHQLAAFTRAVREGAPFPTTPDDAVKNMAVIDSIYRAAGMQPREPATS
ncbi:MAG TPA: Gfo/Idh/MocA family oxidoreductase [Myxococcota bacterium]|jgi:predicted dehydrogenase